MQELFHASHAIAYELTMTILAVIFTDGFLAYCVFQAMRTN